MTYNQAWSPLSARIRGLIQAGHLHAQLLSINTADSYARWRALRAQCGEILVALKTFRDGYSGALPPAVTSCIDKFLSERSALIAGEIDNNMGPDATAASLVFLAALDTELAFLLADTQEVIRTRSERAFVHLQRSIVVDPDVRAKWQTAFQQGEISCEKLGSVHLLAHGIFAFKTSETGERTDLIFNDAVESRESLQGYADGLVLTEWKVAKPDAAAEAQLRQALGQAKRYSHGVLGGIELNSYRYLVIVSEDHISGLSFDVRDNGVIYRQVNIAVKPTTPSSRPRGRASTR